MCEKKLRNIKERTRLRGARGYPYRPVGRIGSREVKLTFLIHSEVLELWIPILMLRMLEMPKNEELGFNGGANLEGSGEMPNRGWLWLAGVRGALWLEGVRPKKGWWLGVYSRLFTPFRTGSCIFSFILVFMLIFVFHLVVRRGQAGHHDTSNSVTISGLLVLSL